MPARYAIYFAPHPDCQLWHLASNWLGRDAARDIPLPQPALPERLALSGHDPEAITARPRHYGFHATLKPPFALRPGATPRQLQSAMAAFAAQQRPLPVALTVNRVGDFLALVPRPPSSGHSAVASLASACVETFDGFRAKPADSGRGQARQNGLNPRQRKLLERWGYPYVMDQFRFHMTLTAPLPEPELLQLQPWLQQLLQPGLRQPVLIDAIALFTQPDLQSAFVLSQRFGFADGS